MSLVAAALPVFLQTAYARFPAVPISRTKLGTRRRSPSRRQSATWPSEQHYIGHKSLLLILRLIHHVPYWSLLLLLCCCPCCFDVPYASLTPTMPLVASLNLSFWRDLHTLLNFRKSCISQDCTSCCAVRLAGPAVCGRGHGGPCWHGTSWLLVCMHLSRMRRNVGFSITLLEPAAVLDKQDLVVVTFELTAQGAAR